MQLCFDKDNPDWFHFEGEKTVICDKKCENIAKFGDYLFCLIKNVYICKPYFIKLHISY